MIRCTPRVISGFLCEVDTICALLGHYAAYSGNYFFLDSLPLKTETICCPETSVRDYHYTLRNIPRQRSCNGLFCYNQLV